MKPKIKRDGFRTYQVIGRSGAYAGYIQRVGKAWEISMLSSQSEIYFSFSAAKNEALTKAERY